MRLQNVDNAISLCEQHLQASNSAGTEVESLLTRAVLVLTCAAFEERIERIIEDRASSLNDVSMQQFFQSCVTAVFRSTKSSELAGLLGRFGTQFKESFNQRASADPSVVTYYNNIVTNRHGVAHTGSVNCTFAELKSFYEKGHAVLDYLEQTIKETVAVPEATTPAIAAPDVQAG